MLKFKGQTESGEWVEFWIYDIVDTNEVWTDAWCLSHEDSRVDDIKTSTIQLADDPQSSDALIKASGKALLDAIRGTLDELIRHETITSYGLLVDDVYEIIDEMEAKL